MEPQLVLSDMEESLPTPPQLWFNYEMLPTVYSFSMHSVGAHVGSTSHKSSRWMQTRADTTQSLPSKRFKSSTLTSSTGAYTSCCFLPLGFSSGFPSPWNAFLQIPSPFLHLDWLLLIQYLRLSYVQYVLLHVVCQRLGERLYTHVNFKTTL